MNVDEGNVFWFCWVVVINDVDVFLGFVYEDEVVFVINFVECYDRLRGLVFNGFLVVIRIDRC